MNRKGTKNDQDKAPLHMIPEDALIGMAEAFAYGARKYDRFNYRKGIEITRLTDSLRRHTLAYLSGEDIDSESGLHHTKHILANAAMIEFMRIHRPELDDRYKVETKDGNKKSMPCLDPKFDCSYPDNCPCYADKTKPVYEFTMHQPALVSAKKDIKTEINEIIKSQACIEGWDFDCRHEVSANDDGSIIFVKVYRK